MPFKSKAQRAYLYATHPEIAAEFQAHTPKNAKLPKHVGDNAMHKKKAHKKEMESKKEMKHEEREMKHEKKEHKKEQKKK